MFDTNEFDRCVSTLVDDDDQKKKNNLTAHLINEDGKGPCLISIL